jgi:hypothetical protein
MTSSFPGPFSWLKKQVCSILVATVLASVSVTTSFADESQAGKDEAARPPTSLEFRIVANVEDDEEAIAAAAKYFHDAQQDPKRKDELEKLARQGLPPTSPKPPAAKGFGTPRGSFTYTWLEFDPKNLRAWGLDVVDEKDPDPNTVWKKAAAARAKGEPLVHPYNKNLLYSRECRNSSLSAAERQRKRFDYFLFTRDPEPGKEITGTSLERVTTGTGVNGLPTINLHFNKKGGDLLFELTSRNLPRGEGIENEFIRALAIVLNGRIIMTPRLGNRTLRDQAVIDGVFTEAELKRIVKDLSQGLKKSNK